MREHQIVITLKPEQFLEIQRLSKAAGAKSMGMFVRKELLRSLGIGKNIDDDPSTSSGQGKESDRESRKRIKVVTQELRRIHGELQTFVAETLTESYVDESPGSGEGEAQSDADVEGGEQFDDDVDELAELVDIQNDEDHVLSGDPAELFEEAKDELEQLAQKAFSISPRLGALQSPAEPETEPEEEADSNNDDSEDPLADLLDAGAASSGQVQDPDQEEEYEVSLGESSESATENPINSKNEGISDKPANQGQSSDSDSSHPKRRRLSGGPPPRRRKT